MKPMPRSNTVLCQLLDQGKVKVNSDGSFPLSSGEAGVCGIIGVFKRENKMGFAIPTKCGSNNLAEVYATMVGAAWCVSHGYTNFVLELDSLIVVNMLKERSTEKCKLRAIIDHIIQILVEVEI